MDRVEAKAVADAVLLELREKPYTELLPLIERSRWVARQGVGGTEYAVKIYGIPDDGEDLQVVAAATDGTRSRFGLIRPESTDFIIRADGTFVDE